MPLRSSIDDVEGVTRSLNSSINASKGGTGKSFALGTLCFATKNSLISRGYFSLLEIHSEALPVI